MLGDSEAQDRAAARARMVAEVDAMYAETRSETGLAAMSPAVRGALGKVERHRLVPPGEESRAYRNHPLPIGSGLQLIGYKEILQQRPMQRPFTSDSYDAVVRKALEK